MTRSPLSVAEKAFAHDKRKADVMARKIAAGLPMLPRRHGCVNCVSRGKAAEEGAAPKPAAQPKRRK
jgi:hypothetical protein